jgi:hypothetical protein
VRLLPRSNSKKDVLSEIFDRPVVPRATGRIDPGPPRMRTHTPQSPLSPISLST